LNPRKSPFAVTRHNEPIRNVSIRDRIDSGISYSMRFAEFDAAIAAGATLDELQKLYYGGYPPKFMALVVVWHAMSSLINAHQQDAQNAAVRRQRKSM